MVEPDSFLPVFYKVVLNEIRVVECCTHSHIRLLDHFPQSFEMSVGLDVVLDVTVRTAEAAIWICIAVLS